MNRYPVEQLGEDDDDGTMPENVNTLAEAVVGRRIVSAERTETRGRWSVEHALVLTLDDGRRVQLVDTTDCCAVTELEEFWLHPESVDHVILGVGTTGQYTTWHIYADFGDIMRLKVDWSCGNPFYYAYGFNIRVVPLDGGES